MAEVEKCMVNDGKALKLVAWRFFGKFDIDSRRIAN